MTNTTYAVRYTVVNRSDLVVVKEKSFRTNEARCAFLDKLEERGELVRVVAMADPS